MEPTTNKGSKGIIIAVIVIVVIGCIAFFLMHKNANAPVSPANTNGTTVNGSVDATSDDVNAIGNDLNGIDVNGVDQGIQ